MFVLRFLAGALALPWTIAFAVMRLTVAILRWPRVHRAKSASVICCPSGHPNPVMGRWTCSCGAAYLGHAFGPCPICGMPAGWMRCEVCGLALRSPWKDDA